jgi:hypothetical protein
VRMPELWLATTANACCRRMILQLP